MRKLPAWFIPYKPHTVATEAQPLHQDTPKAAGPGIALPLLAMGLAVVIGVLLFTWQPARSGIVSSPPNIVLFLTDDQRHDTLEYMPIVQRELVARGVTFTNAYATTPLCCPSRASILTGQYAHRHGVLTNHSPHGGWRRFDDSSTVATWLQRTGVRTMLLGKYLNGYANERIPPGWEQWFAMWDRGERYYDYRVNDNGEIRSFGGRERSYSTEVLARQAVSLLEEQPNRPFFVYLSFSAPHAPATPAKQDIGRFADLPPQRLPSYNEEDIGDKPRWVQKLPLLAPPKQTEIDLLRASQLAALQAVDRAVGSVVDSLRADGRLEKTWLIFMSDNGIALGEHRYADGKDCGYEECARIPLIVTPPPGLAAQIRAPRSDSRIVLNIDVAPTVADLVGALSDRPVDGMSLQPLLRDPTSAWRDEALLESWEEDGDLRFQGLRLGQWKYLRYASGEQELYDLERDPSELDNLAGDSEQAARLPELSARIDELTR